MKNKQKNQITHEKQCMPTGNRMLESAGAQESDITQDKPEAENIGKEQTDGKTEICRENSSNTSAADVRHRYIEEIIENISKKTGITGFDFHYVCYTFGQWFLRKVVKAVVPHSATHGILGNIQLFGRLSLSDFLCKFHCLYFLFGNVDMGSSWLTFFVEVVAVVAGGSILINKIVEFIDKCTVLRSHYLASRKQKLDFEKQEREDSEKKS